MPTSDKGTATSPRSWTASRRRLYRAPIYSGESITHLARAKLHVGGLTPLLEMVSATAQLPTLPARLNTFEIPSLATSKLAWASRTSFRGHSWIPLPKVSRRDILAKPHGQRSRQHFTGRPLPQRIPMSIPSASTTISPTMIASMRVVAKIRIKSKLPTYYGASDPGGPG